MFYQTYGQGPALLLLHSGGMAGEEWAPQIPLLQKRFQLIVPDLPGHGRSPLPDDMLSVEKMGRAVLAMLDELGVDKVHCCGSSMGGAVTLWLTIHHPERVKSAIVYRMVHRKNVSTYAQTLTMAEPAYWEQFGLHKWLSKLHEPQGGEQAWKRVIARVSESLDPASSQHGYSLEMLSKITCPVLVVTGDRDPVAPLEDALAMYHAIPDCGLWIMPFATHITGSNTWRAAAFAEEIKRFISKQSGQ